MSSLCLVLTQVRSQPAGPVTPARNSATDEKVWRGMRNFWFEGRNMISIELVHTGCNHNHLYLIVVCIWLRKDKQYRIEN